MIGTLIKVALTEYKLLLHQGGVMLSVLSVCLSVCLCEQDNSPTRLWMSTEHGRDGQG